MAKAVEIPVYLFTGFLEGGKTRFIRETLEDKKFNAGEHTLLVLCEEGEEEYDLSHPLMKKRGGADRRKAGRMAEDPPGGQGSDRI